MVAVRPRDLLKLAALILAAQGCTPAFVTRVSNIRISAARIAAMPADVEVYDLDVQGELTRQERRTSIGEQNVNAEINRWVTEHGGRLFVRTDVYGTKVGYVGFVSGRREHWGA